jgi:hypothetical protein
MAVYKIPQDVEADDKFVGPLSFKQFIYSGIAAVCGYLSFLSLTKGFWPALLFLLPVITVFGFLGFPWGRDQPTEVWLAARIRFFIKPRVRIWNQSGMKELVTITAPKRVEKHYTDGLSLNEVSSRLSGLADLLDSRGWAVKNVSTNQYASPLAGANADSDRLLDMAALPQEVSEIAVNDDILDEVTSPTAQHFDQMIKSSEQKHRQEVMEQLQAARNPATASATPPQPDDQANADFWFLQKGAHGEHPSVNQLLEDIAPAPSTDAGFTTFRTPDVVAPHAAAPVPLTAETAYANQAVSAQDEQALLEKIHKSHAPDTSPFGHIKTIMPIDEAAASAAAGAPGQPAGMAPPTAVQAAPPTPTPPVTPPVDPAIISLANNDDLNVATIARQADKVNGQRRSDDEVVISLR